MQRYGIHEAGDLELAPAPFKVFEDLLPTDAGGEKLGGARCLPIGFGEDRETRSLPDWSLAGRGRAICGF